MRAGGDRGRTSAVPLRGVGVLVTRPAAQAGPLCRLLETAGAAVFRLPAVEIEPLCEADGVVSRGGGAGSGDPGHAKLERGDLGRANLEQGDLERDDIARGDLVIFTSANAVRFGAPLLAGRQDLAIAAIGPATARALAAAGLPPSIVPHDGYDSEALLRDPRLASMTGRRVRLVKGQGGRELLQTALEARGAQVHVVEVYRRTRPTHGTVALAEIERVCREGALHVVTATSLEIVGNLLELATPPLRACLERLQWLTPGPRVAAGARAQGLRAPILQAASADDQDLLSAIVRWRCSESQA